MGFPRPLLLHPPSLPRAALETGGRHTGCACLSAAATQPVGSTNPGLHRRCRGATVHMPRACRPCGLIQPASLSVVCFSPQAGHELLLLCESDAGARQVLRQAFPGVRIHEDVTSLERLPEVGGWLSCGQACAWMLGDAGAHCRQSWR